MPTEFIQNGDFSSGQTGWTFTGNVIVTGRNSSDSATFNSGNTTPNGAIEQTVTGLTAGQNATLSFEYGKVGQGPAPARATYEVTGQPGNVPILSGSLVDANGPTAISNIDSTDRFFTADFVAPNGVTEITIRFTDTIVSGNATDFDLDNVSLIACFVKGTHIETIHGQMPVEQLKSGMMIKTPKGHNKLKTCYKSKLDSIDLVNPKLLSVRIQKGALGDGLPTRNLLVSRQHRMLVRSKICRRMFGTDEVLVPAIRLTELDYVEIEDATEVEYYHLIFDTHEIIFAEGSPTESFFMGPVALQTLPPEARQEMEALFPEILDDGYQAKTTHFLPPPQKQKALITRHAKNGQAIFKAGL